MPLCPACDTARVSAELAESSRTVVNRVWAERLGVSPLAFGAAEQILITRPELTAAVSLRLGATTAVAAPEEALALLRPLAAEQLIAGAALLTALEPLRPQLLGAASLSFLEGQPETPVTGTTWTAAEADVGSVLDQCSGDEREESGLGEMTHRWAAGARRGEPGAAAGYEVWGDGLAHLGVAVAAGARGRGLGALAAAAAASHAWGAGLVPQWRCRLGHRHSARLAERLGFVRAGEQIAINFGAGGE